MVNPLSYRSVLTRCARNLKTKLCLLRCAGRPPIPNGSLLAALVAIAAISARGSDFAATQWPQFRGPHGSGVSHTSDFPIHFGPESNVVWKTALPAGHSSPCVWNDRIFLTGFADGKLETLCLSRHDGLIVWRRAVPPGQMERGSHLSNPAASTPVTDGARLCVYFGSFGLVCYDFAGQELWRKPLPTPITQHGASTSPVLSGDRLLLSCDQDTDSYLLAVEARTGDTLWKTDRPGFRRGFATPLIWPLDRPTCVILPGTLRLAAYDLQSGAECWTVGGLPNELVASPVAGEGFIFAGGWTHGSGVAKMPRFDALLEQGDRDKDGQFTREEVPPGPAKQHFLYIDANKDGLITRAEYDSMSGIFAQAENALLAVQPGLSGTTTAAKVVWKQTRGLPYVPSPLYYDGRVYLVKNGGLASCFDAQTGRVFYQEERLGALGDYYSSPVAAKGKICAASQQGVVVIFKAGETLEVLARNPLREPVLATPAIVEDELYLRTERHLYAFGN